MKRYGFLNERINVRMTSKLKEKLDNFAREFDVTTAEAARLALYELIDTYKKNREELSYYAGIREHITKMYIRDGMLEDSSEPVFFKMLTRLEKAFYEGLIKINYKDLSSVKNFEEEISVIYQKLLQLDKEEITKDMFRRKIRHYLYTRVLHQCRYLKTITPKDIEQQVDKELKKLLG